MRLDAFRHSVLSLAMVSDQFAATAASILQPRYFEVPAEQNLCRFIIEHYREFHSAPRKLAVRDRGYRYFNASKHLQNQLEDFDVLLDVVTDMDEDAANQADYIQSRLVEFCREQALKDALLKSVDYIQKGKLDEVLPDIQKALSVGAELEGKGTYLLANADERESMQEARRTVPTGYQFMDEPMKGGPAKGELVIIMAPPNVGKTSTLINLGVGAMKNRGKVAHFTLEMQQPVVRAKYDQCFLKKTDEQLQLDTDGARKLADWMKRTRLNLGADVYIKEFPAHRLTIEMLKAHLLLLKSRDSFVPDMIIVDYLDLMALPAHIKEEHHKLAWMGVELRALARYMDAATLTASQTNRGGQTKETSGGEDVAGDFTKLATADAMVSVNQTQKEQEEDEARIYWIKNRVGRKGRTYKILTDFDRTLIQPND